MAKKQQKEREAEKEVPVYEKFSINRATVKFDLNNRQKRSLERILPPGTAMTELEWIDFLAKRGVTFRK